MTTELDWWERRQRQRHEDEVDALSQSRPLTFRCLVCKNITFSPTGVALKCVVCLVPTRMEVIE